MCDVFTLCGVLLLSVIVYFQIFSVDCDSSPCLNGGTCVPGFETGYYCKCADGFYEYHCEKSKLTDTTLLLLKTYFLIMMYTTL